MQISRRAFVAAMTGLSSGLRAQAQSGGFPVRPIKIVVPFTAGSGSDNSARFFGEQMATAFGQAVIVENKPGANGIVALQAVKLAPADGYTVLLASNSPMAVNPLTIKNLGYDSVRDFKPISGLSRGMNAVIVSNDSRFASLDDLLAAARKAPLTVGTYSAGYELAATWLAGMSKARFTNVPYKGQAPIVTDVIGNQLDFALVDLGGAMPLIKANRLKVLAVSGESRNADLPNVPTIRERGFPDYVQYSWVSFYVRSQTPDDITATLAATLQKSLASPEAAEYIKKSGAELMPYPPERMQAFHLSEIRRFKKIADDAGVRPE